MYKLPFYHDPNEERVKELIHRHPFAFLSGCDNSGSPVATQIPLLLAQKNEKRILIGHMMRETDHHKAFLENPEVLAIFTGPNCYVSGSWYSNPHTPSTWNFMSIHIKGEINFVSESGLREILGRVTLHFENENKLSPTAFQNLPEENIERLIPLIAGFEIAINSMEHVFKLSQDRDQQSYENIIEELKKGDYDSKQIGIEMELRRKELFNS